MKKLVVCFVLLWATVGINAYVPQSGGVDVTNTIELYALDGKADIKMSNNKKVVVLHVFASWCGYCRKEHELWKGINKIEGVEYYAVSYREQGEYGKRFLETSGNNPFDRHLMLDLDNAKKINVHMIPDTIVMYNNKILARNRGTMNKDKFEKFTGEKLQKAIASVGKVN
ncbi:MAG: thioredoxin fold domain-containing protein [Pseudomonadota bacterium]|nr:thioredoxin fold domain-containing protein [Pseudomonadota bacterium]